MSRGSREAHSDDEAGDASSPAPAGLVYDRSGPRGSRRAADDLRLALREEEAAGLGAAAKRLTDGMRARDVQPPEALGELLQLALGEADRAGAEQSGAGPTANLRATPLARQTSSR